MKRRFNHDQLVKIGYRWVMKRCAFGFHELHAATRNGEIPDVIGYTKSGTFLLEAKTSRNDYLSDKKKLFRRFPEHGMGDFRFYIVPKGLIAVNELPDGWGLIEVNEKGKPRVRHNPFGKGNIYSRWKKNSKNREAEVDLMYSALRRLEIRKHISSIYDRRPA